MTQVVKKNTLRLACTFSYRNHLLSPKPWFLSVGSNSNRSYSLMATTLTSFRPPTTRNSVSSSKLPEQRNRKPVSSSSRWTSLFGISSDPDYIKSAAADLDGNPSGKSESNPKTKAFRPGSKLAIGCFTEEKARQLRRKTIETSTFHDVMYHSAIASRLASDVSGSPGKSVRVCTDLR